MSSLPFEIPGYYYDAERSKYFRIEKASTAPPSAPWSSTNVLVRRLQKKPKRAPPRPPAAPAALLLRRELAASRTDPDPSHLRASIWAAGLVSRGGLNFASDYPVGQGPNITCLALCAGESDPVGGDIGFALASLDNATVRSVYMPTDSTSRILYEAGELRTSGRNPVVFLERMDAKGGTDSGRLSTISSIKLLPSAGRALVTTAAPTRSPMRRLDLNRKPAVSQLPQWRLGNACPDRFSTGRAGATYYQTTVAPASASDIVCACATSHGIAYQPAGSTELRWLCFYPNAGAKSFKTHSPSHLFDIVFDPTAPSVLFAGGRRRRLWTIDRRTRPDSWSSIPHPSSITCVRAIDSHRVLAAGCESAMALYDLRFCRPGRARPWLTFADYANAAALDAAVEVDVNLGVVAAAHDDGTVALYGLRSGQRLPSPEIASIKANASIKSLVFHRGPSDNVPSLFVGVGGCAQKFGFAAASEQDRGRAGVGILA